MHRLRACRSGQLGLALRPPKALQRTRCTAPCDMEQSSKHPLLIHEIELLQHSVNFLGIGSQRFAGAP